MKKNLVILMSLLILTIFTGSPVVAGVSGGGGGPEHPKPEEILRAISGNGAPADRAQKWAAMALGRLVMKIKTGFIVDLKLQRIFAFADMETGEEAFNKVMAAKIKPELSAPCYDEKNQPVPAFANYDDIGGAICLSAPLIAEQIPSSFLDVNGAVLGILVHEVLHQAGIRDESEVRYVQRNIAISRNNLLFSDAVRFLNFATGVVRKIESQNFFKTDSSCKQLGMLAKEVGKMATALKASIYHEHLFEANIPLRRYSYKNMPVEGLAESMLDECNQVTDPRGTSKFNVLQAELGKLKQLIDFGAFTY